MLTYSVQAWYPDQPDEVEETDEDEAEEGEEGAEGGMVVVFKKMSIMCVRFHVLVATTVPCQAAPLTC